MTYDGLHKYTYDPWNRLVKVARAWPGGFTAEGAENAEISEGRWVLSFRAPLQAVRFGRGPSREDRRRRLRHWGCVNRFAVGGMASRGLPGAGEGEAGQVAGQIAPRETMPLWSKE